MVRDGNQIKMPNMGELRTPPLVTPLVAMIAGDAAFFEAARVPLEQMLGPVELQSELYPFNKTAYYAPSMGENLFRQFFSFKTLADASPLPDWKLAANEIEANLREQFLAGGRQHLPERPINLDPGYITGAKLVLASTKDFAHRLYLRDGIFAEITMGFRGDSWVSHDFTFPDFKSGQYDNFLKKARDWHLRKVKNAKRNGTWTDEQCP